MKNSLTGTAGKMKTRYRCSLRTFFRFEDGERVGVGWGGLILSVVRFAGLILLVPGVSSSRILNQQELKFFLHEHKRIPPWSRILFYAGFLSCFEQIMLKKTFFYMQCIVRVTIVYSHSHLVYSQFNIPFLIWLRAKNRFKKGFMATYCLSLSLVFDIVCFCFLLQNETVLMRLFSEFLRQISQVYQSRSAEGL